MSTIAAPLTVEEFLARPEREDGCAEELIDGEVIVSPNAKYNHSLIVTRLVKALLPLEAQGFVVLGEVACYLDERSLPNPDVAVIRQAVSEIALRDGWLRQASELAVEVVSPGNRKLLRKVDLYLANGAEQVWLVDPRRKTITVHTAEGFSEARMGESVEFHGCTVPVSTLFEGI
jgi:Uma2 family endonuclease